MLGFWSCCKVRYSCHRGSPRAGQHSRYAAEMEAGLDGDMHSASHRDSHGDADRQWGHEGFQHMHDGSGQPEERKATQRQDPSSTVFIKVGQASMTSRLWSWQQGSLLILDAV